MPGTPSQTGKIIGAPVEQETAAETEEVPEEMREPSEPEADRAPAGKVQESPGTPEIPVTEPALTPREGRQRTSEGIDEPVPVEPNAGSAGNANVPQPLD